MGLEPTVSWAQQMKERDHPFPYAALSLSDSKKVPIYCWVDRIFESTDGETGVESDDHWRLSTP